MSTLYSKRELRYFRLAKGVVDYSTAALRKVFKREWDCLYPTWQNDRRSGSRLLAEEQPSSRLYDPAYCSDYQHIKRHISCGDVEEWDVTTLVFALLYSHALSSIRFGYPYWRTIQNAIYEIKKVRNTVLSHASKAAISGSTFERNINILVHAVGDLLTSSDPLVEKLEALLTETEFVTDDLVKYKQWVKDDHDRLVSLEKGLKRLEDKMRLSASESETTELDDTRRLETPDNSKIISRMRRRISKLEQQFKTPVDQAPSRSKPEIFRRAKYIRLINESSSMSYNFRWKDLEKFLQGFDDDIDLSMFAGIQSAVSLSHQSKKSEASEVLHGLIPNVLMARNGVVLHARIKIRKAYILHDAAKGDEVKETAAMKEVDEAEMMLSLGECHEDTAEINYAKANIILSANRNSKEDRGRILLHLDKCICSCGKATVDKSVTAVQATLRKALVHLGFFQHGILEDIPMSDVDIAETILNRISAEQSEPLSERSKVFYNYGRSLLAYLKGDTNMATKLENKARRKCELHKINFEIQQLNMLRTLIRGMSH